MAEFVSFNGKEQVIKAYDNRGIDTWSIFQGKDLMFAGSGKEELENCMEMLSQGDTRNRYRLCVYNGDIDTDTITNKTENNGSFTFRLQGEGGLSGAMGVIGSRSAGGTYDPIVQRLTGLVMEDVNKAIDKRLAGGGEEKEESVWDKIGNAALSYVEDPEKLSGLVDIIGRFIKPGYTPPMQVAGVIGNVQTANVRKAGSVAAVSAVAEGEDNPTLIRLSNALERLEKCDPEILIHLEQLADLAEKNPAMYKMALNFLKG